MKRIVVSTVLTALLALWTMAVFGAVPQLINFQGILRDGSGNPVANGSYFATFRIYNAAVGGTTLWADTQTVVTNAGLFNATLGIGTPVPDSVFNDSVRFLGITIFPDPEMAPRQRLTTSGYSFRSEQWTSVGSNVARLNGNVGIGTASPTKKLEVAGSIKTTDTLFSSNVSSNSPLSLQTSGTTRMYIDDVSGNVGIGTTSPATRLQVNGTVTATSFAGNFGQSATTVFGSSGLSVTISTFILIPGLTQTLTVPSNSVLYIATDGGIQTTSSSTTGFSTVDVVVMIDGALVPNGGFQRRQAANTGGVTTKLEYWSQSLTAVLTPGNHTIDIRAALVSGSTATVSGNNTSVLQGELTVAIIKQ